MSEDEDLELLALQRQLDDAFQTTRPRRDFEDELWLRMQSRRPIWRRVRDGVAGLVESIRESPAVPSAAVAVALIVLLGAGIFTLGGLGRGGGTSSTAARPATNDTGAVPQGSGFGPVPRPVFGEAVSPLVPGTGHAAFYAGAATLVWAGDLKVSVTALPVYRYAEPTAAQANAPGLSTKDVLFYRDVYKGAPNKYAEPLRETNYQNLPPAFLVAAGVDPLHDDCFEYAAKLKAANVKAEVRDEPLLIHAFLRARHMSVPAKESFESIIAAIKGFAA